MPSFLEKLKKGMDINETKAEKTIEDPLEDFQEEKEPEAALSAVKKPSVKTSLKKTVKKKVPKKKTIKVKEEKEEVKIKEAPQKSWFEGEGQLTVDVYETDKDLVIQSAVAGVKPENLDINFESDMVIIKGKREEVSQEEKKDYFFQECYWGYFSREVLLPKEVDASRAKATMTNGVLTIRIPKIERNKKRKITVER